MFSGLVEAEVPVLSAFERASGVELRLKLPDFFDDVQIGDSISVNGVCLTVEAVAQGQVAFFVGPETLAVTGWTAELLGQTRVNLERSLKLGDRLHGHFVLGHVDGIGQILQVNENDGWRALTISLPKALRPLVWLKGSVTVNGVSLTVNETSSEGFRVDLIPETLRLTNLGRLAIGDTVTIEVDQMARGLHHWHSLREATL
jgi:riboflavin synthase